MYGSRAGIGDGGPAVIHHYTSTREDGQLETLEIVYLGFPRDKAGHIPGVQELAPCPWR